MSPFEGNYSNQTGNYVGPRIAAENRAGLIERLQAQKASIFESYDGIDTRRCPHCHQYQSWMHSSLLDRKIALWCAVVVAAACIALSVAVVWKNSSWGDLPVYLFYFGLGGLVVWFIAFGIVRAIFRRKEKTASKSILKKPPVLIWEAGDSGIEA
jgi:hypothetical protein